jgi:hypothetical protein
MVRMAFVLLSRRQSDKISAFAIRVMSRASSIPLLEKFGQRLNPVLILIGIFAGFSLAVLAGRAGGTFSPLMSAIIS